MQIRVIAISVAVCCAVSLSAAANEYFADPIIFDVPDGGGYLYSSPEGKRVFLLRGDGWYRFDLIDNVWNGPILSATCNYCRFAGWKEETTGATLLIEVVKSPVHLIDSHIQVYAGSKEQFAKETGASFAETWVSDDEARDRLISAIRSVNANAIVHKGTETSTVTYSEGGNALRIGNKGRVSPVNTMSGKALWLPEERSDLLMLDLLSGSTTVIRIQGHVPNTPGHGSGVLSPDGGFALALFGYEPDTEQSDQYWRYLQLFSAKGQFLCDVAGIGDIRGEWIYTDYDWLKSGWIVYTTGSEVVFRKFVGK